MVNAFNFQNDTETSVATKTQKDAALNTEIESAKQEVAGIVGASSNESTRNIKSGGTLFSAGGGSASSAGMSRKEIEAKIVMDKKKKKFAKLFADEPEEPKLKILTVEMMEAKRKTAAKQKRAERREAVLESLKSKGTDDGKGAQRLLTSYVDEVLSVPSAFTPLTVPTHVTEKKSWQECSFAEKLFRNELKEIPLVSQVVAQKSLIPVHTQKRKKEFEDLCRRLLRNDGTMVRLRLNGAGLTDAVAKTIGAALEKNLYAQHLMMHDNRLTDIGVEHLCTALRWHPSVHTIWLGGNPITDRGCAALANLAHLNHNIKGTIF